MGLYELFNNKIIPQVGIVGGPNSDTVSDQNSNISSVTSTATTRSRADVQKEVISDARMLIDQKIDFTLIAAISQAKIHRAFLIRGYCKLLSALLMIGSFTTFPFKNYNYWECEWLDASERYECDRKIVNDPQNSNLMDGRYVVYVEKTEPNRNSWVIAIAFLIQDILELVGVTLYHRRSPFFWFVEHHCNAAFTMGKLPENLGYYASWYVRLMPFIFMVVLAHYLSDRILSLDLGQV